jgi:hypothetical protein
MEKGDLEKHHYSYLDNPRGSLEQTRFLDAPLNIDRNSAKWDLFDLEIQKKFRNLYRYSDSKEDGYNLMSGTCNLINTIIQRHEKGETIETLLFLDRSARLGAYLFGVCWDIVEKRAGARGSSLPLGKPKIRFVNSGTEDREKHQHKGTITSLGELFQKEDFKGSVMIVDEYVSSGGSVRRTGEGLINGGYRPQHLYGIAQFMELPYWYNIPDAKGVREVDNTSEDDRVRILKLPSKVIEETKKLISIIGANNSLSLPGSTINLFRENLTVDQKNKLKEAGIDLSRYVRILKEKCEQEEIDVVVVVKYFVTAGGFKSLPPFPFEQAKTIKYRAMLREIAEESFNRGLVIIDEKLFKLSGKVS